MFAGVAVPDLAAAVRPFLAPVVIGTLTVTLLRLDWQRLSGALRRPRLAAALTLWLLVVAPLVVWFATGLLGLPPDLRLVLLLQAAAPPIGSAAVFVLILGFDGVVAMIVTVAATLLLPLTLTPLVGLLLPEAGVQVDLFAFFVRVTLLVVAPFAIAALLRRLVGSQRLARSDEQLAGLSVLMLVALSLAVMDGVTAKLLAEPWAVGRLLGVASVATVLLHLAGWAPFYGAGTGIAVSAAVASGNRNLGLILAVTGGTAGETFSLFVGIAQIPMFVAPLLMSLFISRRLVSR